MLYLDEMTGCKGWSTQNGGKCLTQECNPSVWKQLGSEIVDGITNGQFGWLVDVIKTPKGNVDKLVIRPKDPSIGEENRRKFPQLANLHPGILFLKLQLIHKT